MKRALKTSFVFLLMALGVFHSWLPVSLAQEINVGEFSIEIDLKDLGKSEYRLTPAKADKVLPLPHILSEKKIAVQAQVFFTEEENLRLVLKKPVLLHVTDTTTDTSLERLIPHINIELSTRQRSHFVTMFMNGNADLIATMDVPEQELDLSKFKDISRLNAKDFSDGRAFFLPVISKPLKILQLPFLQLQDLLTPTSRIERTNIEVPTLEVIQIRSQNFELVTGELRLTTLAETMEGVLSKSPEIQKLVELRTQAHIGREQMLDRFRSGQAFDPEPPQRQAQILSISQHHSGLRCRQFLKDGSAPSTGATGHGQVIPFPFGNR